MGGQGRFIINNGILIQFLGGTDDVVIPDGVIEIGAGAFRSYNVKSVHIPDGVVAIGDNCFTNCKYLKKIRIPASVKTISDSAFCNTEGVRVNATKGTYAWEYVQKKSNLTNNSIAVNTDKGKVAVPSGSSSSKPLSNMNQQSIPKQLSSNVKKDSLIMPEKEKAPFEKSLDKQLKTVATSIDKELKRSRRLSYALFYSTKVFCWLMMLGIQSALFFLLSEGTISRAIYESGQSFILVNVAILGNALVSNVLSAIADSRAGFFIPHITNICLGISVIVSAINFWGILGFIFIGFIEVVVVGGTCFLSGCFFDFAENEGMFDRPRKLTKAEIRAAEEKKRKQEQEEANKRALQEKEKRDKLNRQIVAYRNHPLTKEILPLLIHNKEVPYLIEISGREVAFQFENGSGRYVFAAHGGNNINEMKEKALAEVLNQKLGNIYNIEEQTKFHSFTYSDGTLDGWTEHVCTTMKRKTTRGF